MWARWLGGAPDSPIDLGRFRFSPFQNTVSKNSRKSYRISVSLDHKNGTYSLVGGGPWFYRSLNLETKSFHHHHHPDPDIR